MHASITRGADAVKRIFMCAHAHTVRMIPIAFVAGALGYMGLELAFRGRTHYSMGLAGGICASALFALYGAVEMPPLAAYLAGAVLITAVELVFGMIFNVKLGLRVWDYSTVPLNFRGQICLRFSLVWGALGLGIWAVARAVA